MIDVKNNLGYPNLISTSVSWLPMDSEELFDYNYKNNRKKIEKYNWTKNSITYKFNKFGFRSDEFGEGDSIVFLGCSFTIGIGVPANVHFSNLVATELNLNCYNLGIGGGSNDCCFRLAYYWLAKLKPKICVYVEPEDTRFEIKCEIEEKYQFGNYNVQDIGSLQSPLKEFYPYWLYNDANSFLKKQKNLLGIQKLCDNNSIKFIHTDNKFVEIDYARDLVHPGIKSNANKAQKILNKITVQ